MIWTLLLLAAPQLAGPTPSTTVDAPPPRSAIAEIAQPPPLGLGAKLASRIRRHPAKVHRFLVAGTDAETIRRLGGAMHAQVGGVIAGAARPATIRRLARAAQLIDAPQSLRPMLNLSRVVVRADEADFGDGFEGSHRGAGALIAMYDSGVDTRHPDFRDGEGKSRLRALRDDSGVECRSVESCAIGDALHDPIGHGTHVLSVAGGNAPKFRGVAPEAGLVVASSTDFEDLVGALAWFDMIAAEEAQPMVINVSLGGHEGAHDGTSLEAEALDASPHVVVAAAGNEGDQTVHARVPLSAEPASVGVDFNAGVGESLAIVEIWGTAGEALAAEVIALDGGVVVDGTDSITIGAPGRTATIAIDGATVARVELDAEAADNPRNGRPHIRLEVGVPDLEALLGRRIGVVVTGGGHADLWLDAPARIPRLPHFFASEIDGLPGQIFGDAQHTVSDPATARNAIAVGAFVNRAGFPNADDVPNPGAPVSTFSARGPSTDPERTGPKPDIAAPGERVAAAAAGDTGQGSRLGILYRSSSGTSVAAPHVAGAAAVLLGARPDADVATVRAWLLDGATRLDGDDPDRVGAGRVDVAESLALAVGRSSCGCRATHSPGGAAGLLWLLVAGGCLRASGARVTSKGRARLGAGRFSRR